MKKTRKNPGFLDFKVLDLSMKSDYTKPCAHNSNFIGTFANNNY